MKKLTAIRLINWHAFIDEKIKIHNSVLISGENGAGKSTVLDAIQFILTCDKSHFNKAANENSKRTLSGYVRYKTGREDMEYERTGDITSHIALEFYEEAKRCSFVIGAVIDSSAENSENVVFYKGENINIEGISFINKENIPHDISKFRSSNKDTRLQLFRTYGEAKKAFLNKLGYIDEKFYKILPKSLAFKPITDVKDFVYSYILDEKEIKIDALRDNIRTYKEFDALVRDVKERIGKLNEIKRVYTDYEKADNLVKLHDYIIALAEEDIAETEISRIVKTIESSEVSIEEKKKENILLGSDIEKRNDLKNKLIIDLNSNEEYKTLGIIKEKISAASTELARQRISFDSFNSAHKLEAGRAAELIRLNVLKDGLYRFINLSKELSSENLKSFKECCLELEEECKKEISKLNSSTAEKRILLKGKYDRLKELEETIGELEKRNLKYPDNVTRLRQLISRDLKKIGIDIIPRILCELIDVTDPAWKNAIEGYLNTQRFYLIVEKEHFNYALKTYEKVIKEENIHSVGLINVEKLEKYDNCEENSLAYLVTSKNNDAKKYINMILGRVTRCEKVEQLKLHDTSITQSCMLYKNHVARAINPEIYRKPYIGDEACKIQLEEAKKDKILLLETIKEKEEDLKHETSIKELLEKTRFDKLMESCGIISDISGTEAEIQRLKKEEKELSTNNNFIGISMKIESMEAEISSLKDKSSGLVQEIADLNANMNSYKNNLRFKNQQLNEIKDVLMDRKRDIGEGIAQEGLARFQDSKRSKEASAIKNNFTGSRNSNITRKNNYKDELESMQWDYNRSYDFGAATGVDGVEAYFSELDNYERSKIIEYEEQVKTAKKNAEEEFKEHFIAKIQENINNARKEFRELNRALKGRNFGNEEFEFVSSPSKDEKIKRYYDMIMDDENIGEGLTLFSMSYQSKYREVLDDLFEKLTISEEYGERELNKFTDYRTYMNYDIRIKFDNGKHMLFSKVCREKSGGETQTPYYVAMAASFVQLYNAALYEPIGLILFDEAFDKMDESRIVAMMEFLNKLPLQIMMAAPPQKIETIAPFVNTTLLAIKAEDFSIIEELRHEKV